MARKAGMKSDSADMMSSHQIHTLCYMKVINECLSEFVQFRYRWDWKPVFFYIRERFV